MHFIEQIFGLSPDGGSGLTELLLFLFPSAGALWALILRRRQSHNRR